MQKCSDNKPACMLSVPYIKELSEKSQSIGSRFNITALFKTKNTIGGFLRKMKPNELRDKPQCMYRIPCKCGREYNIGETSRTLGVGIKEHICNIRQCYLDRSKLAAHDFEEGNQIDYNQSGILQSESNTVYRKYREATHNPINQSDVDITPVWSH